MKPVRILIVDGSSTTRQTLDRLLGQDGELEVVAAVATGRMALAKLFDLVPDLIVLDVAQPDLEGFKTLAAIRETHASLPIIVFSRLTERGSQTTVDALLLGATDYVTRPESNVALESCVRGELTSKIKTLGNPRHTASPVRRGPKREGKVSNAPRVGLLSAQAVLAGAATPRQPSHQAEIVAIATSTGGPNALASLLSALPASFDTPIVVVQHMASGFTNSLADSLRRQTGRNVREVDSIQPLDEAGVWIAPGGRHLVVTRQGVAVRVSPNNEPSENGCCPSANVLFRSVAEVFGTATLAVVLTGMGNDGLSGCRAIRQAGGTILVQDEASSIAWGMPGQVAIAGLADGVLPLSDLPSEICRLVVAAHSRRSNES